jgi:hypothetical protein
LLKFTTVKLLKKMRFQQHLLNQQKSLQLVKQEPRSSASAQKVTPKPVEGKSVTNSPLKASDPKAGVEEQKVEK